MHTVVVSSVYSCLWLLRGILHRFQPLLPLHTSLPKTLFAPSFLLMVCRSCLVLLALGWFILFMGLISISSIPVNVLAVQDILCARSESWRRRGWFCGTRKEGRPRISWGSSNGVCVILLVAFFSPSSCSLTSRVLMWKLTFFSAIQQITNHTVQMYIVTCMINWPSVWLHFTTNKISDWVTGSLFLLATCWPLLRGACFASGIGGTFTDRGGFI